VKVNGLCALSLVFAGDLYVASDSSFDCALKPALSITAEAWREGCNAQFYVHYAQGIVLLMHTGKNSMVFIFLIFINIFLTELVGTYVAIQINETKTDGLASARYWTGHAEPAQTTNPQGGIECVSLRSRFFR
jgi:hypothetical protein